MTRYLILPAFLLLTVGGGALFGRAVDIGSWFQALEKPWFNPPDWLFAPIWGTLYVLIGFAGYRVWRTGDRPAQILWWAQMALNFAWSPIFFTAQAPGFALMVILALLLTILSFILRSWSIERLSAILFLPYLAWVAYATLLNGALWWLN